MRLEPFRQWRDQRFRANLFMHVRSCNMGIHQDAICVHGDMSFPTLHAPPDIVTAITASFADFQGLRVAAESARHFATRTNNSRAQTEMTLHSPNCPVIPPFGKNSDTQSATAKNRAVIVAIGNLFAPDTKARRQLCAYRLFADGRQTSHTV
jgi:hypothetical protein